MGQVVALYIASVVYSAIRYVVFAPKNLEHLPVFVVNKGVSMGAALCFAIAFLVQWRRWRGGAGPRVWFRAGIFGVCLHIPMSLAILRPVYFKEFFLESGRMSFGGEAVFLFGALTAGGIYLLTRQDWTAMHRWMLSLATMVVLFLHTLFMGIARGLNINASHAYLPPMWLLSLIGIGLGLAFVLLDRPAREVTPAGGPNSAT
jgi:hypothetical protein